MKKLKDSVKDPFIEICIIWALIMIMLLFYLATDLMYKWIWCLIIPLFLLIVIIYQVSGGPEAFWYYNTKLNKNKEADNEEADKKH